MITGDCVCLICRGTGKENIYEWICTACGGFGWISEEEQIEQKEYYERLASYDESDCE